MSDALSIPTIGIGAGQDCDGQVCPHDMLGITTDFSPRFLEISRFESQITGAVEQYCEDVRGGDFPNDEESYRPGLQQHSTRRIQDAIPNPCQTPYLKGGGSS